MPSPSIPIDPEMPELDADLTAKITREYERVQGFAPSLGYVWSIYNAARAVLKEEQGL